MNMLGEEPPYLSVGTEVSAKYKGAFCEAKVRKVDRLVKCKVVFKLGFGSHTVLDNQIKGILRVSATIEARHPEKKEYIEGTITKIQDCSQYTVVFDDGDITTLRRSALCLKSGRHFAESETLDQLPLTHPEHFGNPVVGGRRGGRRRLGSDESSGEEELPRKGKPREELETEIGKVVCVELSDKKKVKDWFPGLVVSPCAQDTVRIRVKEEFLVRSFKDARYYTVPKKEATEFTREIGLKVDNDSLRAAVEKALTFLDKDELPPHWDREQLFSHNQTEDSDSDVALDSDSSDDEPREEKDHFVAQLYKFMDDRGTPINGSPSVCSRDLDLYKLFKIVHKMNGYNRVSNHNQWKLVSTKLAFGNSPGVVTQVKHAYKKFLHSFEDFYRKLGCTMVNHPRTGRSRNRGGRSLIRDRDRATPINIKTEIKEESVVEPTSSVTEVKKVIKEEDAKVKVKVDETKGRGKDESKEADKSENQSKRPPSSLRKTFPTLKASPRTKEESPVSKRRAEKSEEQTPNRQLSTRPRRTLRENSLEDGRTSEDENVKNSPSVDEQRSTTRAKSKEDLMKQIVKKDATETPRGKSSSKSSDSDGSKKGKSTSASVEDVKKPVETSRGKRLPIEDVPTKRNRKRRNTDNGTDEPARPCLPRNKSVFVGDILKVYYGTSNDPNGVYEAKVVDIDDDSGEQMFLVHYSGWNSRYDEWVKRNKIAENLTWTARRAKASPVKATRLASSKKKAASAKTEPTRSTTPSSITSSSSRTKSPATPIGTRRRTQRRDDPMPSSQRRTRRMSGHTEASVGSQSESESESVESETDSENKASVVVTDHLTRNTVSKIGMRPRPMKKPSADPPSCSTDKKKPRIMRRNSKLEKENDDIETASKNSEPEIIQIAPQSENDSNEIGSNSNEASGAAPKGRDFDLNEIRSELKGIDKAVKVNVEPEVCDDDDESDEEVPETNDDNEVTILPSKSESESIAVELDLVKSETIEVEEEKADVENFACNVEEPQNAPLLEPEVNNSNQEDLKEDVYEFKEPEPFDFQEVRRPIRIFDEISERSPEKGTVPKASPVTNSPARPTYEKRETSPQDEIKSRFRKTISKKLKEGSEEKRNVDIIKADEEGCLPTDNIDDDEAAPPQLVAAELMEVEDIKEEEGDSPPTAAQKLSPEPPCLVAVTEALPCQPPEHSPMLTRQDLPRLRAQISSSDSEGEERLIIANDEESTSNEVRSDLQSNIPSSTPPLLALENSNNPLSETRLKKVEDNSKPTEAETFSSHSSQVFIESSKPSTSAPIEKESRDLESSDSENCLAAGSSRGSIRSLVCDEVIPGSPAAKDPSDDLAFQPPTASVIENTPPTTPPTTPDSNASSPRQEMVGGMYQSIELSSVDNESSKSHRDSSELDMDQESHRNRSWKYEGRCDKECSESPTKRKRTRKRSESVSEIGKRISMRNSRFDANNSDSDDTSDNSMGIHNSDPLLINRSPRPYKYNFCKETAQDMDSTQKINYISCQIQDLRKTYLSIKNQVASIDRRKKKLRKKDRESKVPPGSGIILTPTAKSQEMACA